VQVAEEGGALADGQGVPSLRYLEEVRQHHERPLAIARGGVDCVGGCAVDWEELFHERDYARKRRGCGVPAHNKSALPRAHGPEGPAVAGGRCSGSLGERNVIEMTGVTALVGIRAVAALVGVSGTRRLTVEAHVGLLHSLTEVFSGHPDTLYLTGRGVVDPDASPAREKAAMYSMATANVELQRMSTVTGPAAMRSRRASARVSTQCASTRRASPTGSCRSRLRRPAALHARVGHSRIGRKSARARATDATRWSTRMKCRAPSVGG